MSETPTRLTAVEAAEELLELAEGWILHDGKLHRWFDFKDFAGAIAFVNTLAKTVDPLGHHPDIHIHYNKVLVELFTHEVHGLTDKDFEVAEAIDKL